MRDLAKLRKLIQKEICSIPWLSMIKNKHALLIDKAYLSLHDSVEPFIHYNVTDDCIYFQYRRYWWGEIEDKRYKLTNNGTSFRVGLYKKYLENKFLDLLKEMSSTYHDGEITAQLENLEYELTYSKIEEAAKFIFGNITSCEIDFDGDNEIVIDFNSKGYNINIAKSTPYYSNGTTWTLSLTHSNKINLDPILLISVAKFLADKYNK